MDDIKDIIQQVMGDIAAKKIEKQGKAERIWLNIIDEKALKHTALVGIKNGIMWIAVDSPAWLYQMRLKKKKLLNQIKEEVPDIKDITFKIGKVK